MSDIIRVLRLVQIVGPRDLVEEQVNKSLHGTKVIQRRDMRQLSITSITIGEFPEMIVGEPVVVESPYKPDEYGQLGQRDIVDSEGHVAGWSNNFREKG